MSHRLSGVAALGVAALFLAGCASIIPTPEQLIENTVEDAIENATGGSVDIGTASLPSSWPGLPTPDGTLLSSIAADGSFALTYQFADESPVTALSEQLLAQGFEVTAESDSGFKVLVLANSEWTVSLGWYDDDEGAVFLNYGATPTPS